MPSLLYPALDYGVAARPLPGQKECGDQHAVIPLPFGSLVAVADGLGHGHEAAVAAKVTMITLAGQAHLSLPRLVERCHEALKGTRGVVVSIASLEWRDGTLTWLSIGNVEGLLLRPSAEGGLEREHILARNGVVGHRLPPLRTARLKLRHGDVLLFATDGIREGFHSDVRIEADPQETADRILARYAKPTDDALVLVGRWKGPPSEAP
jgi:serine phosphatase RsbU (regulator of sigma subunit)